MDENKVLEIAAEAAEAAIKVVEAEPKAGLSLAKKAGVVGVGFALGAAIVYGTTKLVKKFKAKKSNKEEAEVVDADEKESVEETTK